MVQGAVSIQRCSLTGICIPIINIRRSYDCRRFTMEISIRGKEVFIMRRGPDVGLSIYHVFSFLVFPLAINLNLMTRPALNLYQPSKRFCTIILPRIYTPVVYDVLRVIVLIQWTTRGLGKSNMVSYQQPEKFDAVFRFYIGVYARKYISIVIEKFQWFLPLWSATGRFQTYIPV